MNRDFSVYRKIDASPSVATHGRVYTRSHIVELILDLACYPGKPPESTTLLDPGCGNGAFVVSAIQRFLANSGKNTSPAHITNAFLAVDKDQDAVEECQERVVMALQQHGISKKEAERLANAWVVCDDFLEMELDRKFDFIVGNPPYVRQEAIPKDALERYRSRFQCFYDRADLYVAFIERGLELLSKDGVLGFICPNRFTRNKYGSKLRAMIAKSFQVRHIIDLPEASPFEQEVMSYPGIYLFSHGKTKAVDHVRMTDASDEECQKARRLIRSGKDTKGSNGVSYFRYDQWFTGTQQWSMESPEHLKLIRQLEDECVPIGENHSGCQVGIGVASGADGVYIVDDSIDIEPEVLMPIVTTADLKTGEIQWAKRYIINPFNEDGSLVDLGAFPKLAGYFKQHEARLKGRNVGKRNPTRWYRTIDRIYPDLQGRKKLLIPDIKADNLIVLEEGRFYPHHNLYYVTSEKWSLQALQAILRSSLARFFVWMYGVKMRGGFLRFQAQYLRRICVPQIENVPEKLIRELEAVRKGTTDEIDDVVSRLYNLSDSDMQLIRELVG